MLSLLRHKVPRSKTAAENPVKYEDGRSSIKFHTSSSEYMMTHTLPPGHTPTMFAPPLHLHLFQRESFRVASGTAAFYLRPSAKNPDPTIISQGETVEVPIGAYHRFENGSRTEPLVVDVRLDLQDWAKEESFFRNFFGYLEDCRKTEKQPSVLQLFVFLHAVDGPLAVPMPAWVPDWVKKWVSRGVMLFFSKIGRFIMGYRASYNEYYRQRRE